MIGREFAGKWQCQAGESLYYPGEACFGLLRLHALTNHAAYLDGATQGLLYLARSREDTAWPTPATHAILAQLKAGETVYQAGELPATLRVSEVHYEPPKTVCNFTHSETPYASISRLQWKMVTGLGSPAPWTRSRQRSARPRVTA